MTSRRAGRPRDAGATRAMLLDAATAVFSEQGFAGARVDEIARRAGVNKALIYAYYGDKGGLYRAVLSSRLTAPLSDVAISADLDPRRALEEVVRRCFRAVKDRAFARLLAWDLLSGDRRRRDALVGVARPAMDLVADVVRRARGTGALPGDVDPELFRTALVSVALGYPLQHAALELTRAGNAVVRTDEEFVDYACRLLLGGDRGRAGGARGRRGG